MKTNTDKTDKYIKAQPNPFNPRNPWSKEKKRKNMQKCLVVCKKSATFAARNA